MAPRLPQALLVATGSDHPGILDDISSYVTDRRGSIEAVRVINLRGRFALLVLVTADEESLRRIGADMPLLCERTGVRASLEAPDDPSSGHAASTRFRLSAAGESEADEATTLKQVANLLRVLNINILDVSTSHTAAGGFQIGMLLDVPRDVPVGKLRELMGQLLNRDRLRWELAADVAE